MSGVPADRMTVCPLCDLPDEYCGCCPCPYIVGECGFYVRVGVPGCPVHDLPVSPADP
jgi:hypothetical protein